ncbi:ABC transporter permease [Desulfovibrio intestinalis]|uniref:NitT/TauT family transport system permease protein n=1 Tax=Desulfovibrio intestinalis TaxID=58621 RepID=A0A7W8C0B3_9BACT|nr:ABC transporter permease subunit [Desulfovibrio intestinalis]MBB5142107.1 NitT/TauT family transport system permease protein [Desulfovibrio intestinalis]
MKNNLLGMNLRSNLLWRLLGIVFFLGAWQWVAARGGGLALASPLETWSALADLAAQPWFWTQGMLPTLGRVLTGFAVGFLAGGLLGWAAGIFPEAGLMLLPFRWVLSSVPGVVLVILAMLWCGVGSGMIILIVALTCAPTIYMALQEGLRAVDPALCEMARAYRVTLRKRFTELYLPAVAAPLVSACVVALGGGMRVAILGETLGASQGLGYTLALARADLNTPMLYAVALVSMLLVSAIEATFLRCLRNKLCCGGRP